MDKRGRGRPRYSRPGGRRNIPDLTNSSGHDTSCLLTRARFAPTLEIMDVQLSADQRAFFSMAVKTGRLSREEDAVEEALLMWEERERTRAEILALVDSAEASLSHGQGRVITQESMRELADGVKQRGRALLAAEQAVSG